MGYSRIIEDVRSTFLLYIYLACDEIKSVKIMRC